MPTGTHPIARAEGRPTGGPTPPDVPNGNPAQRGAKRRLARPVAWRRRESFGACGQRPHPLGASGVQRSRKERPIPPGASCARRTTAAPPRPLAAGAGGAPRETQEA